MTDKLHSDIAEIKKCLVGTEFDRKDCLIYRFDQVETKVCVMENQLNTLMQDREKRLEVERAKAASKLAIRKVFNVLTFGLIKKLTTGI